MRKQFLVIFCALILIAVQNTFAATSNRGNEGNITVTEDKIPIDVSGTISDASGEPLIGVNVLIKGTSTGTSSDFNGQYTIAYTNRKVPQI